MCHVLGGRGREGVAATFCCKEMRVLCGQILEVSENIW